MTVNQWRSLFLLSLILTLVFWNLFLTPIAQDYVVKKYLLFLLHLPVFFLVCWLTYQIKNIQLNRWQKSLFFQIWGLNCFLNTMLIFSALFTFIFVNLVNPGCMKKYVSPSGDRSLIINHCSITCQSLVYENKLLVMKKIDYIGINLAGKCPRKVNGTTIEWNEAETKIYWQFEAISTGAKPLVKNQGILELK